MNIRPRYQLGLKNLLGCLHGDLGYLPDMGVSKLELVFAPHALPSFLLKSSPTSPLAGNHECKELMLQRHG